MWFFTNAKTAPTSLHHPHFVKVYTREDEEGKVCKAESDQIRVHALDVGTPYRANNRRMHPTKASIARVFA